MKPNEESVLMNALEKGKIPELGSLGLLALGDLGLKYWRLSRDQSQNKAGA